MSGAFGLLAALGLAAGCGAPPAGPLPDRERGVELVRSQAVQAFYARATQFYAHLEGRRFNSRVTFRDPALRAYFRSERAFSDYYADLAQALAEAHFERNRPLETSIAEFLVDGEGRARVRVRIRGESGLPLRWWSTALPREDRWERVEGEWWIIPGRL